VSRRHRKPRTIGVFLAVGAVLTFGLTFLVRTYLNLHWLVAYLIGVNCGTFFLYGYDKFVSSRERTRVPEKVLHLFALAGGTPFAYIAQRFFRHKTVKPRFRRVFWTVVVIQIAAIAWAVWYTQGKG